MTTPPTEDMEGEKRGRSPWLIVGVVVGLILVLAIAWAVLGGGRAAPTPEAPVLPTAVAESSDAVCDRVDETGTIIVGTAGDYPPFEFYNDQFRLDGFDIALANALAEEMGITAQFKDYAFDGLFGALQLGEIDAAMAAITVTDERQGVVDFSDGYYTGVAAALARAGAEPSNVATAADFAGWRVGVERGTIYESWAEANLVSTGVIPEQQLFAYEKAADAVGDLQQDRIDVVLLDSAAAGEFIADGSLAIVGEGGVVQSYAVAIPQDAACIQRRINLALAALAAEGVIEQIAQGYIGVVPPPAPTPTPGAPAATPTPVPAPVCIDSSEFVMDLTYDDQGGTTPPKVQPGQSFTKGWRIRNSGTCRWGPDYRLNYVGGNSSAAQMDGEPVYVTSPVDPGQTYDFYVDLNAPSGVYGVMQGRWQMQDPGSDYFGQTVWVMVDVVAPTPGPTAIPPTATPTVAPTALPTGAPTVTPPEPTPTALPDPFVGQTFAFYAINGLPTIPGTTPSLTFGSGGQLSGSDGCNTFQGDYTVQPAGITQGAITMTIGPGTAIACPADVADQAHSFLIAVGQTTAYSYPPKGLLLTLLDPTGTDVLNGELQ